MWAMKNFSALGDFFAAAGEMGFARIELNHQVDSAMLAGIDLSRYVFSSVHEPCPADISVDQLKGRDWLISAADEANRREGARAVRRSIELARELGATVVVVHAGAIPADPGLEAQLRRLLKAGQGQTPAYATLSQQLERLRREQAGPRLGAVRRSLLELLEFAAQAGVRLGLENRYHYLDIPGLEEMGELLDLAGPEHLGFIYDVGHAQTLDRLGFYPHEEWLRRYAPRMVGAHLHDVIGTDDHLAAGRGEVDFARIAPYLPAGAFRTCEFHPTNTAAQVRAGLAYLAGQGIIKPKVTA
jgi:sugar phosphate isomerase/epimerase